MLAVEPHAHSGYSPNGHGTVDQLLEAATAAGLDGIAITDHEFGPSERAASRAEEYGLIGIPGIEMSTAAGHLLGLEVDHRIERGRSFRTTIEVIHDVGGIAVVPHPFQELREGVLGAIPREELRGADAIEAYNSRLLTGRADRQADQLAETYDMSKTAGSDAHGSEMVGQARTLVDTERRTTDAILQAIRDGETTVQRRRTPYRITPWQAAGSATRRAHERFS